MDSGGILGFQYGIVQAPLGPDISGPELVAAVANAGGLGLLRSPDWVTYCLLFLIVQLVLLEMNVICCCEASSSEFLVL